MWRSIRRRKPTREALLDARSVEAPRGSGGHRRRGPAQRTPPAFTMRTVPPPVAGSVLRVRFCGPVLDVLLLAVDLLDDELGGLMLAGELACVLDRLGLGAIGLALLFIFDVDQPASVFL